MKKWSNRLPGTGLDELRGWQKHLKNRTKGDKMPQLTNKEVENVYRGPAGTNNYGDWQVYNFTLVGGTKRYGYMQSGKKPVPVPGTKIVHLLYETENKEVDGTIYENNKVTELMVLEGSPVGNAQKTSPEPFKADKASQVVPPQADQTPKKEIYTDYGKCMLELLVIADCEETKFLQLVGLFKRGLELTVSPLAPQEESKEPEPIPIDEQDIPF